MSIVLRSSAQLLARVQPLRLAAGATIIALFVNAQHLRSILLTTSQYIHDSLSKALFNFSRALFGFEYNDCISNQHIRLIQLSDSASGSSPNLTLQTFKLDECPPYIALSYTWGPVTQNTTFDQSRILLNARPFPVLPNLHHAIRQLCISRSGQYLWVDGICINQRSLDERSAQVAIMDLIYNGAAETVIWLGLATDETARGIELVQNIAKGAESKIIEWGRGQSYGDAYIMDDPELLKRNGLPNLTESDWLTLRDIYTRPWFGRVWMLQEVALSRNPRVLIGHHEAAWDSVGDTAGLINMSGALIGLFTVGSGSETAPLIYTLVHAAGLHVTRQWVQDKNSRYKEILRSIDYSIGIRQDHPKKLLLELLLSSIGFKATIPRDRVYSLLGIVNFMERAKGRPRLDVIVDYEAPNNDILIDLGISFFRETKSLHLLSLAGTASRAVPADLPTWIPSFETVHVPVLGPSYTRMLPFDAAAGKEADFTIDRSLFHLNIKIHIPHLGTIEELGESWSDVIQGKFNDTMKMLLHCGTTYVPTGQPIVEAFWRTLIMDCDLSQRPAPSHLADSFSKWMLLLTIQALIAYQHKNPSIYDQFDALEPLWTLANTRDSTNTLPKSGDIIPLLFELGLRHDPSVRVDTESEKAAKFASWGKTSAPFEALLRVNLAARRRIARTIRGYLCLVPLQAKTGDKIMILAGCAAPLVLRRSGPSESLFQLVGDAYVHGAMFGEHVTGESSWRDVHLV
ncbi:heterokaryon incompatibility (het-6OR allele) [Fusarium phyllophilum]|uniref:Heterokaryon incompatibility (Het-6OR allele) n=1 Tax=Fusarium phyllophilum TaxID=47803 RepID=A0A8H5KCB4_9HYPO|nr:heterokaryon incompatibility (het-6OR allele) [Fusarium phyllophilum]